MISRQFFNLSGLMLCLSGITYILDTALEALTPDISPGIGLMVPIFGLMGFPGFWLSLHQDRPTVLAHAAYGLSMLGLAGLVAVTFINNRVFPDLPTETTSAIIGLIRPEFLTIGVTFLLSAILMLAVCWPLNLNYRIGAILYAVGAIPVSLPPVMPAVLVEVGGVTIGLGLLIWGAGLLHTPRLPQLSQ